MEPGGALEGFVSELTRQQRRLWAFAYSLLGSRELADECMQETNLVLWRKAGEFEAGTDFSAWATRVTLLQVKAMRKRLGRGGLLLSDALVDQLSAGAAAAVSEERLEALRRCLRSLSPRQYEALRLFYGGGQGVAQTAESMSAAAGAVKSLLHRTRQQLVSCVERRLRGEVVA